MDIMTLATRYGMGTVALGAIDGMTIAQLINTTNEAYTKLAERAAWLPPDWLQTVSMLNGQSVGGMTTLVLPVISPVADFLKTEPRRMEAWKALAASISKTRLTIQQPWVKREQAKDAIIQNQAVWDNLIYEIAKIASAPARWLGTVAEEGAKNILGSKSFLLIGIVGAAFLFMKYGGGRRAKTNPPRRLARGKRKTR